MPERLYIDQLSDFDRVVVRFVREGKLVTDFSVQHEAFVEGKWHKLVRYDTAHGLPHRHTFQADGSQRVQALHITDLNLALTHSITVINKSFLLIRESYIILMENDRRKL
jgi:hypothetical protein